MQKYSTANIILELGGNMTIRSKITKAVINGIAYKVEDGDLYYLDTINNKYEMVTYFEDFSEFELHFLKRTLPKFNLYHGEYL
jgi:hypothetical protein